MAGRAGSHAPVGSAAWVCKELTDLSALCENELEDFAYSARNETEWLNEHMADIFSSSNLNIAELMKTPGKLRGKTPRTVRQRSPLKEVRQPLGEIASIDKRFNSPLNRSPARSPVKLKPQEGNATAAQRIDPVKIDRATKDSGYHGEADSMSFERELPATQDLESEEPLHDEHESLPDEGHDQKMVHNEGRSTEGSFHSAKENQTLHKPTESDAPDQEEPPRQDSEAERAAEQLRRESAEQIRDDAEDAALGASTHHDADQDEEMGDASSENSTPAKAVVRKSSITFPVLPAREPLATKKSMGNRVSGQTSALSKSGYHQRFTGGRSFGTALQREDDEDEDVSMQENGSREGSESDALVKMHKKNNTVRLHERISALGKYQNPRPTKSIPSTTIAGQASYPVLPTGDVEDQALQDYDPTNADAMMQSADEHWIPQPTTTAAPRLTAPAQQGHAVADKNVSSTSAEPLPPFQIHQDEPELEQRPSTTPAGSPPKHLFQHGPLNASKSKLQSIMQSARGLFSSSAAASAQAKLEAASVSSPAKTRTQAKSTAVKDSVDINATPLAEGRRTRSSTEKEEKQKREQQAATEIHNHSSSDFEDEIDELAVAEADGQDEQKPRRSPSRPAADDEDELAERPKSAMGPPARPRTMLQKSGINKRPLTKPAKDSTTQQKVSIKIGSMAGRRPLTATTLSTASKAHETATQTRSGAGGKKESTASQSTTASSAPSFKSSTASTLTKPKALLAAQKKKEADQKAAQRKLEQKKELERRKAAQQEEAQRREQERQALERQKEHERQAEDERKRQEQRQAVEKKRAEQQAKREQMQRAVEQQALKASTARPVSRQATLQDFPRPPSAQPQTNTVKGSKRVWNPDQDEQAQRIARPQTAQNYRQTQEGKRRKTDDEETVDEEPKRSNMAPPVRLSNILKNGPKPSIFGNYPRAPPPASHHQGPAPPTSHPFKQSYGGQGPPPPRPGTAMDIARFQNGAIPFANQGHPPAPVHTANPAAVFKTPLQASKHGQPQTQPPQPKSSPFINGEYVHLDEIQTDSESEDSEDERERKANLPDWVLTPNLQQTLVDQETLNPDSVFGPIAPLNMNDIFKDAQARQRLRNRTSSANWFGTDKLSEEDKIRDLQARERMRQDGGWSFENGV